jgi:hypothetical protein
LRAGSGGFVFGRNAAGAFDPKQTGVNQPGAVKAAEQLATWLDSGLLPRGVGYAQMESAFHRGEVAMMISGPWAWDNLRKNAIDFGVAPMPSLLGHAAQPFVGVLGCMIGANSPVKDIAREFIENHLLREGSLKILNADVPLGTPANKAFYAELAADPAIRATMDNFRLITAPLIVRPLTPLLISAFAFNFNNFVLISVLTDGRPDFLNTQLPAGTTDILVSYTYRIAFQDAGQNFGLAAAISTLIFALIALMSLLNLKLARVHPEKS